MSSPLAEVEKKFWAAADDLRANSGLRSSEYSTSVPGLIFLRFAGERFATVERELGQKKLAQNEGGERWHSERP